MVNKCIVLDFESAKVEIFNTYLDNPQIEEIEELLIEKGYSLSNIEYMFGDDIKINRDDI